LNIASRKGTCRRGHAWAANIEFSFSSTAFCSPFFSFRKGPLAKSGEAKSLRIKFSFTEMTELCPPSSYPLEYSQALDLCVRAAANSSSLFQKTDTPIRFSEPGYRLGEFLLSIARHTGKPQDSPVELENILPSSAIYPRSDLA